MTACACETESQHPHSPGLVEDEEEVVRAGYDPTAVKKTKVTAQLIRGKDLRAGSLSVWRSTRPGGFDQRAVSEQLERVKPQGAELAGMFSLVVSIIRGLRIEDEDGQLIDAQVFCVKDDCRTDDLGGWHADHATIGLGDIDGIEWEPEGNAYLQAKEVLYARFKARLIWSGIERRAVVE